MSSIKRHHLPFAMVNSGNSSNNSSKSSKATYNLNAIFGVICSVTLLVQLLCVVYNHHDQVPVVAHGRRQLNALTPQTPEKLQYGKPLHSGRLTMIGFRQVCFP